MLKDYTGRVAEFVNILESFDSHERGILLRWALGGPPRLDDAVRTVLESTIDREIPGDAFLATDYVLDWLFAATQLLIEGDDAPELHPWPQQGAITASQEDVDMLVAWSDVEGNHLLLIEAKGFTGWKNSQMKSKATRLGAVFPPEKAESFDLHFILVGPKPSKGLSTADWPPWMRPGERVYFLSIPDPGLRKAVQRCDKNGHATNTNFSMWRTTFRKWGP